MYIHTYIYTRIYIHSLYIYVYCVLDRLYTESLMIQIPHILLHTYIHIYIYIHITAYIYILLSQTFLSTYKNEPLHHRISDFNLVLHLRKYFPAALYNEMCAALLRKKPFSAALIDEITVVLLKNDLMAL